MDFSLVNSLEVALGQVLIYYVLSLIVSTLSGKNLRITEMHSQDLMVGLQEIADDSGKLDAFTNHPMIQNQKTKRVNLPSAKVSTKKVNPIPSTTFALALFEPIAPGVAHDANGE